MWKNGRISENADIYHGPLKVSMKIINTKSRNEKVEEKLKSKTEAVLKISIIPVNTSEYKLPCKSHFSDYILKIQL